MWVLFFFLKFVESEIFFQVSKYFPKAPKKNPGALFFFFVVLWVGLGGRQPDPPPLCRPPAVLQEVPDCVGGVAWGWWDGAPSGLRAAAPSRAGWGNSTSAALPSPWPENRQ